MVGLFYLHVVVTKQLKSSFKYQYNLKDQLGNIRVTIDSDPSTGAARVIQEDEYYAFGLDVPKHRFGTENKYLYNGKEKQDVLVNKLDYGARFYDPVIARWTSVDPLAEKDRRWSPYSYGHNNPIRNIDIDGLYVKPGDLFSSIDDAAKDFGKYYNAQSIIEGREYASAIYKIDKGGKTYYSYTEANPGTNASSTAPLIDNTVADVHTHGKYTGNEPDRSERYDDNHFSPKDKQNYRNDNQPGYVATPNGSLKKFNVHPELITTLSIDLPSDGETPLGRTTFLYLQGILRGRTSKVL